MASITTWMRLEPHSRAADMEAGLEMRIHDPLWLLARQWQFGEFHGEDTGSPVWAEYSRDEMPITFFLPGSIESFTPDDVQEYSHETPLEYLVEREQTSAQMVMASNRRLAVEAGQHFLRLLEATLVGKYRRKLLNDFGLKPLTGAERNNLDKESLAFLDLMAGRVIDGARLLDVIQGASTTNPAISLGFDPIDDAPIANSAIADWKDWCMKMAGPVDPPQSRASWNPARMEYSCALATPIESNFDQIVLAAAEYPGGHLDWYSFDEAVGKNIIKTATKQSQTIKDATLPTALSFRGLPASRLWEFEDAKVRFGSITAAPTDLARMLLVEFLIQYGNDFFVIPIESDTGSLVRINGLKVINTFGDDADNISPFMKDDWRMFALSTDSAAKSNASAPALFLPPVISQDFTSPPIEDLHLLRDEIANIAWAVERFVESKCGKPLDRHEEYQARQARLDGDRNPPGQQSTLVYRLDTWDKSHPDFWIPLLPISPAEEESPMQLECHDPQNHSKGLLLSEHAPGTSLYLYDEEVPRTGAQVTRTQQYSRWYDGGMFVWIGREKRLGRGEGSSGLRNDIVETVDNVQ